MQDFQTIQLDKLHFLDSYAIGHAGQGIIAEGKLTLPRHYHGSQYELTCILQGEGTAYYKSNRAYSACHFFVYKIRQFFGA